MSAEYRALVEPRLAPIVTRGWRPADGRPALTRIDLKLLQASCPGA